MRILVTGAAGFIGSHLSWALLDEGHQVTGIDNLSTGRRDNFPEKDAELVLADIRDYNHDVLPTKWDVIYHCAASYKDRSAWELDASTNVLGTINVVREAIRTDAKLIYFQTSLCYGPNPDSPVSLLSPLDPHGSYAVSKTAGENYIRDAGIPFVSLRLANIYGPRNLSGPVPAFYQRLSAGKPCTIVDSRRDFVYIDDLLKVALKAVVRGQGMYHVSSGRDLPIGAMYDAVVAAMGITAPRPAFVPRGPDDVATLLLDPLETLQEFGWAAHTPLVTGIAEAVRWYQSHSVTETFTHLAMKG